MIVRPPYLQINDKVAIVATGRRVSREDVEPARNILMSWGLEVVLSPNLFNSHSYLSAADNERLSDLQLMLDDPTIRAIFCARGGYGTTRILDAIEFNNFLENPKWIIGFSDVTALHLKLMALQVESIHATMPILFNRQDSAVSIQSLKNILFDGKAEIEATWNSNNILGEVNAPVIGGNLSLIVDSLGTTTEVKTAGKILVIEEIDEFRYKLDRMMVQLNRAGKLKDLAGLVVGHLTDIKDSDLSFGFSAEEIILQHTKQYGYPIGFGFPIGHENPNLAWRHGSTMTLKISPDGSILESLTDQV